VNRVALLDDAYAKLDWAQKRLDELKVEVSNFTNARPYKVTGEHDFARGDYVIRVSPEECPPLLPLLVSDVLCSLRPSLDYVIYALSILDSGAPQEGTQFPICSSPEQFASKQGWIQHLSDPHKAAIESLQPYPGRQAVAWLATLRELSNPDKHRHLHTTNGLIMGEFRLIPGTGWAIDVRRQGAAVYGRSTVGGTGTPAILKAQNPQWPSNEVNVQLGITVGVTFDSGSPVEETLQILESQVRQLIDAFKPEFE